MSFFQVVCHHKYLHSPKTWLHKRYYLTKLIMLMCQLILIPHAKLSHIVTFLITVSTILFSLKLSREIQTSIFRILFFYFLIFIVNNQSFRVYEDDLYRETYIITVNTFEVKTKFIKKALTCKSFIVKIPKLTFRALLISYIYIISIKVLMLTTRHETIITVLIFPIRQISYDVFQDITLTTILGLKFSEILSTQVSRLYITYKTRGKTDNASTYDKVRINYLFTIDFFNNLAKHMTFLSFSLYNRNINLQNSYFLNTQG
uniref:Uncharacterized protein n=1 Tax=Rhodogorgon sp. TaxID=2485824 RepID=A0A3G3MI28_9FLOR|nr:hypothetical protein [Rhodogorgon sp.]